MSKLKLNAAIAKENPNGQIFCMICKLEVKPKAWLAHNNGRKHRAAIDAMRHRTPKRNAQIDDDVESTPSKRAKDSGNDLPSDFFDESSGIDVKTPWQKAKDDERQRLKTSGTDVIEGLPHGFFDDKRMDNRVRETKEKNAQMDEEYDRFIKEINEQQTEEDQKADEEIEKEAISRDLHIADEQMEGFLRLNEMEIRKEQLLLDHRRKKKEDADDDDADELEETDFDSWRTKKFI